MKSNGTLAPYEPKIAFQNSDAQAESNMNLDNHCAATDCDADSQAQQISGNHDLFDLHHADGVMVVRPAAALTDQLKIHQFATELAEMNESAQPMRLLLDFERVQFFGSEGFRLLLSTQKQLRSWGGRMVICGMNEFLRSLLRNFEVHKIFEIHDSTSEARAAFQHEPVFGTRP